MRRGSGTEGDAGKRANRRRRSNDKQDGEVETGENSVRKQFQRRRKVVAVRYSCRWTYGGVTTVVTLRSVVEAARSGGGKARTGRHDRDAGASADTEGSKLKRNAVVQSQGQSECVGRRLEGELRWVGWRVEQARRWDGKRSRQSGRGNTGGQGEERAGDEEGTVRKDG